MKFGILAIVLAALLSVVGCGGDGGKSSSVADGVSYSAPEASYKSYEVLDDSIRFRINIPQTLVYIQDRVKVLNEQIAKEADKLVVDKTKKKIAQYENLYKILSANKPVKICVFGAFNGWETFISKIPNILIPSASNPDTWYTMTNVSAAALKKGDPVLYKFVIDCGVVFDNIDGGKDEFIFIEDPMNPDITDDGFNGFNSKMVY